ncbi:MAG TPA: hypothetical protein VFL98_00365 [Candidatus Paceibacterota bacterium]|nr:hypothetical protein [Candidatus Paceibacterota bacterium]
MNRNAAAGIAAILILAFGAIALYEWLGPKGSVPSDTPAAAPAAAATTTSDVLGTALADITYQCDAGKTIRAVYYPHIVIIDLSDGRAAQLMQDSPTDAGRYATDDGAFVFMNGTDSGAMLMENGTPTYRRCLPPAAASSSAAE